MIGVSLAGADAGTTNRGAYGIDYIYPGRADLDYFHDKGIDLIRLSFKWERMQPTLGEPLDPAEVARMAAFLDEARALGMKVVVDLHNYGRYDGELIGSDGVSIVQFRDFWTRFAEEFGGHEAVEGYGLMNEPHGFATGETWPGAAQAAADGIRTVDDTTTIVVCGDGWSGPGSFQALNYFLKVTDPVDRVVYEAHLYFDRDASGRYLGGYDQDGVHPMLGVERVQPFITWLRENNARGFVGEVGIPADDPRWMEVLDNLLQRLEENDISSAYWSAGPWNEPGEWPLTVHPQAGQDRPQLHVLIKNAGDETFGDLVPWSADSATPQNLIGTDEADVLDGGDGDDFLVGGLGNDDLRGRAQDDTIGGQGGNDVIAGGAGLDSLWGDAGDDTLQGGDSHDRLDGGPGDDLLEGGAGPDMFTFGRGEGHDVVADFRPENGNRLDLLGQRYALRDTSGGLALDLTGGGGVLLSGFTSAAFQSAWAVGGLGAIQLLIGSAGDDTLAGGPGDDVIGGREGNDRLDGNTGNDELWGDGGADTFVFGPGSQADIVADFRAIEGDRLVLAGTSYVLRGHAGGVLMDLSGGGSVQLRGVASEV